MDESRHVEATAELEWLLGASSHLHADTAAIKRLLATAVEEMNVAFGALTVPTKQVSVTYASRTLRDADSAHAYRQAHPYVMVYMQRHAAPLVANHPPCGALGMPPVCKIMAAPIAVRRDKPVGVLAFCKPISQPDFSRRELNLARRIARMLEWLLDRRQSSVTQLPIPPMQGQPRSGNGSGYGAQENGEFIAFDRLRSALDQNRLQIFAQRIAPLRDIARTSDIECLVRLVAEDGAIIPPAQLLPVAERHQLLTAVDEWMLDHTLAMLEPHAPTLFDRHVHVAFNMSEQSLCDEEFLRFVEDRVSASELEPTLLTFEISEAIAARNLARTDEVMTRLRRLGCSVALDDFGARLVSLGHLQSLRPDRVKLDSKVVRHALDDFESEAIIRTIVKLADALYVECVAKHVDSDALADKLRDVGVGYAQGNCLHTAEPLARLLETNLLASQDAL
jgi:EAL domain-containing protein (putative c-di-GMP-specific phosphodiesterase class I)